MFSAKIKLSACVACTPTAFGNGIKLCGAGAVLSILMLLFEFNEPLLPELGTGVAFVTPDIVAPVGKLNPTTFNFCPDCVTVESLAPIAYVNVKVLVPEPLT